MTWRADVEPYGRRSCLFQIALHLDNLPNRAASVKPTCASSGDRLIVGEKGCFENPIRQKRFSIMRRRTPNRPN
jgi:hypothetical protein